jgi:hypothetical protein
VEKPCVQPGDANAEGREFEDLAEAIFAYRWLIVLPDALGRRRESCAAFQDVNFAVHRFVLSGGEKTSTEGLSAKNTIFLSAWSDLTSFRQERVRIF